MSRGGEKDTPERSLIHSILKTSVCFSSALLFACVLSPVAFAAPSESVSFPPAIVAAPPPLTSACLVDRLQVSRATAEQMVKLCSDALQSHTLSPPQVALARLNRGGARMALGDKIMANVDYAEALKHYDGAIDPLNPDALAVYRRATALDAIGQTDRALSDYDEAIRLGPKDPLAFIGRGVLLATRKRFYARAISDFSMVLALSPDRLEALMRRGDAYSQMGNFGPALADLDRAVALAPDNAEVRVYRGLANARRGDASHAQADYTAALALDPQNVDALVNRAAVYSTAGDQPSAIRDLDAAIARKSNDPMAFYNRGYAHFANRDYALAMSDYSAAIGLDPEMGVAFTNRCLTGAIIGRDLPAALADCDTALTLMPNNADAHEARGFTFLKRGEPERAIPEYDTALALVPNQALSLYGRSLARTRAGHAKEAAVDKASALALDPAIARQFSMFGLE